MIAVVHFELKEQIGAKTRENVSGDAMINISSPERLPVPGITGVISLKSSMNVGNEHKDVLAAVTIVCSNVG